MVKVTAMGLHNGVYTILQCVKNEDSLKFLKNGIKDIPTHEIFKQHIQKKYDLKKDYSWLWLPPIDSAEAYWAAFHEIYFDELPEIEVEGKLDTFGSPYSNEDTSGVVF